MAAASLFAEPFAHIVDADNVNVVGAKITIFETGSSTPAPVYHDSGLSSAWTQPIVTNAAGQSDGTIYCTQTPSLKIVVVDADDAPVTGWPVDPWSPYALGT